MKISYTQINNKIKKNTGLVRTINILDRAITFITIVLYVALLYLSFVWAVDGDYTIFYRSILIPGVSFIIVSIYRYMVFAPRPYEVYDFTPVLTKDTAGKSFPSRHVFSIFIVAATYAQVNIPAALIICLMGIVLAILRVAGGVHFVRDVIWGMAIGVLCGVIGYGLICGVFGLCVLKF